MKLLYLIKRPLNPRDRERFGVNYMIGKGHDVTVLDFSDVIHPETPASRDNEDGNGVNLRVITDWKQLEGEEAAFAEADLAFLLILNFDLSRSTYRPLKMLAKTKTPYLVMAPVTVPGSFMETARQSSLQKLDSLYHRLRSMNVMDSVISRLPRTWLGISAARYKVLNGLITARPNNLEDANTETIYAHAHDYDICMEHKKSKAAQKKQAVFIDQYLPHHPDAIAVGVAGRMDPDNYYRQLRQVFALVEKELGLPVVIAAHPRADYRGNPDVFGGRKTLHGETTGLIGESALVLCHTSTALGMAVILRKPVMILVTQGFLDYYWKVKHLAQGVSNALETPLHFIDDPDQINLSGAMDINERAYERYISNYVKHPKSPQSPLWGIVSEAIT